MAWTTVTPNHLKKKLAKSEFELLSNLDKDNTEGSIIADLISYWINAWRQQCRKVGPIDPRDGYVPDSIVVHLLAQVRYEAWTRMPNSGGPGLDDRRVKEYDRANHVFDNIEKYALDPVEVEPVDPEDPEAVNAGDPLIIVPRQYLN